MKKRILSCVLSAALLLGLTPWSALATDDPLDDQTSQTELQTNFQSPPQNPDIYADPQPNITTVSYTHLRQREGEPCGHQQEHGQPDHGLMGDAAAPCCAAALF